MYCSYFSKDGPSVFVICKLVKNVICLLSLCYQGGFPLPRNFYVRTCVKFSFANKIEAMYERSFPVNVKVELWLTLRLRATLHTLPPLFTREQTIYVEKV